MMRFFVTFLALLLAAPTMAAELPSLFEGVRPLGMGGAFTAVADDENALFYNPAGLNQIEKRRFAVLNPLIDASENGFDFFEDVQDTDFDTTKEVTDLIRQHLGENFHFRAALFPHYVQKNFGIGGLGQLKTNLEARNLAFPVTNVEAFGVATGQVGLAYGLLGERLRIGATARYVSATSIDQSYTAGEIADPNFEDRVEDDAQDGSGLGFDLGAMYALPLPFDLTVAAVIQNLADTDLGDAGKISQQINFGVATRHSLPWFDLTGALDWVDVANEVGIDDDIYKRIHLGVEARLPRILSLRTGLYQGYGSFGATLDFRALKIDYANYAEEIGAFAGSEANRRHILQVSLGW